ncbi:hypothetical protein JK628_19575 [Shewanella sp. KX20019]|uniref:hypothetical protein n=1 Tax=Shewanella sp. KX20019 TaxID=2803864 RepID=UPI0019290196|nr:hypothetical protein [Shewanella sp. KX20019]QQX79685.1 hypothetical protein JK628_19575 [Shewanella sp. KX20019]
MNYSNITTLSFSGRMAFLATILFSFSFIGQANANDHDFTAAQQAAVDGHFEILAEQQAQSDQELSNKLQADFDDQVNDSEDEFMELNCEAYGYDFDSEVSACIE